MEPSSPSSNNPQHCPQQALDMAVSAEFQLGVREEPVPIWSQALWCKLRAAWRRTELCLLTAGTWGRALLTWDAQQRVRTAFAMI